MTLQPVVVDNFGGLQLSSDPEEAGLDAAVNCLNTDTSIRGELRCRPGTANQFTAVDTNHNITGIVRFARYGEILYAQESVGMFTSSTSTADTSLSFANFGTPSTEFIYYAKTTGIGKLDSALAFSNVAAAPAAAFVTVTPTSNRLVAVSGGYDAKVNFSDNDPTAPAPQETFSANNFVYVEPGDDELFRGVVTWRDKTFMFKETRFFVFTTESTDGTGQPVFNYYSVKNTVGVDSTVLYASVCTGVDGVYFIGRDGIYRTTGDTPVKMSAAIDAWFKQRVDPLASSLPSPTVDRWAIGADERRLYFGTAGGTFVMDFQTGQWSLWSLAVSAVGRIEGLTRFTGLGIIGKALRLTDTLTTDSGATIDWTYRSGSSDFDVPVVKKINGVQAWGTGSPTVSLFADHATTDAGASALTLGVSNTARGQAYYGRLGTFFSVGLSGVGGDIINRVIPLVGGQRLEGVG